MLIVNISIQIIDMLMLILTFNLQLSNIKCMTSYNNRKHHGSKNTITPHSIFY